MDYFETLLEKVMQIQTRVGTLEKREQLAVGGAAGNHALLSNLAYASAAHTGFEPTITTLAVGKGGTGLSVYAVGDILYASGTTTISKLADVAVGSVLISKGVGVAPAWSTDIATGVTIGTKYIYRVDGTDVGVADGGTGLSVYAVGDILYASGTTTIGKLADVAVGSILVSGGVGAAPAYSATPVITTSVTCPKAIGGSAANNALTLQANSAASGNTASNIVVKIMVGDSGAIYAGYISNDGKWMIGSQTGALSILPASPPMLEILRADISGGGNVWFVGYGATTGYIPNNIFWTSAGTVASPTALLTGVGIGRLAYRGYNGTAWSSAARAHITVYASGNWAVGAEGTYVDIATTLTGSTTTAVRMRIGDSGSVLIGTTTDGMTEGGSLAIAQDLAHRGTKVGLFNAAPVTQPTHVANPTDLATCITAITNILTRLETLGVFASA